MPTSLDEVFASPADVFDAVKSNVWVVIAGESALQFKKAEGLSQGSAIAISKNHLLTNCHVLERKPLVAILQEKTVHKARLISSDSKSDKCILQSEYNGLSPVLGVKSYASVKVGERVYTIGAPQGLELTLGEGIVSGLREYKGVKYIQTTAPISPGSSGGGLFDSSGNLIGITTFLLKKAQALNFAIAADEYWR
jgi:S1-C subfamily serine protease